MPTGYSSAAVGGALTTEQVQQVLLEPLQASSVVLAALDNLASGNIMSSDGGAPLRIPKIDALALSDPWRAEHVAINEEDITYGSVVLMPTSLKSLKVIHRLSNEIVRHSVVSVLENIGRALTTRVGLYLDAALLAGDGASDTIKGLTAMAGITTMAGVGVVDVDDLHDAELNLLEANAQTSTAAWFMAPRDLVALRKLKANGQYIVHPDPREGGRYQLLGHPVYTSTQIAINGGAGTDESKIVLADMAQVVVAVDKTASVEVLTETYAATDELGLRVTARFDIAALNPTGIVIMDEITPV